MPRRAGARRPSPRGLRATAAAAALAGGLLVGAPAASAATPSLTQLVGQRLVVAMAGTRPDASLLARVRAGKVGGVILFSPNIVSPTQLAHLTASLQSAARAGGQPRLLIATDQEGGLVKRLSWAPPNRSAQELGALTPAQVASSGSSTGAALRAAGVNVDLAPVADVPNTGASFIWRQHRAFSTSRFTVAEDAAGFAQGLELHSVWPTLKHFPGLGRATVSTDEALVTIGASQATLVRGLLPYQVAFRRGLDPIVMLSTAVYPAFDWRAAAWSPPIIQLLRGTLGFTGVTMTDSLDSAAAVRHETAPGAALRSAEAGADLLLVTGSQETSRFAYQRLLAAAQSGALRPAALTAAYDRIVALKHRL
jgi:beta-N-acetylhexosaminidase